ncbi:hypothetical protein [Streptomyces decoyicus]|uniref:hypothetical protein n=1 Tax=Streptomyces decoyicus TaxID=249567 RepID=UPI0037FC9651
MSKGGGEEAEALIATYGIEIDVAAELAERARGQGQRGGFRALFSRCRLRSTVLASVFWAALVLLSFAIRTFWTKVFEALHTGDNALRSCWSAPHRGGAGDDGMRGRGRAPWTAVRDAGYEHRVRLQDHMSQQSVHPQSDTPCPAGGFAPTALCARVSASHTY